MQVPRLIRLAVSAVLTSAVMLAPAIPAHAGSLPIAHAGAIAVSSAPRVLVTSRTSAGYDIFAPPGTGVSAYFKVPSVTCGTQSRAITAGVALSQGSARLLVGCKGGKAIYWPTLSNGTITKTHDLAKVSPGDVILALVQIGSSSGTAEVADLTTKTHWQLSGSYQPVDESFIGDGAWIVSHHLLGVPSFGSVVYYNCTMNDKPLPGLQSDHVFTRVNGKGVTQIATSSISHSGFAATFEHSWRLIQKPRCSC